MKKVLFGITGLTVGGAERVLVDVANRLCDKYDITNFTIYGTGILQYQLNRKIKVVSLFKYKYQDYNFFQKIGISLKLLFGTKAPEGYDTTIAFLEGPITRLFSKAKNTKKIAWVHTDISHAFGHGISSKIKLKIDKRKYKKYDKIIFVSQENRTDFNKVCGKFKNEMVIRNYIDYNHVLTAANQKIKLPFEENELNLLTVCRLHFAKAVDRYIRVHARLEKEGLHSKVYIIGDGDLRLNLQKQIDDLGVTDSFYLLGEKTNPYPYIKGCDYFCLLSSFEGSGMVLDEAKILNKPLIITDTASKENVEDYDACTICVNTEDGIYQALKKTISDYQMSKKIRTTNKQFDKKYYEDIIQKIESII